MVTINTIIIIVGLPPILRGMGLQPPSAWAFLYLVWSIMSYIIVVSVPPVTLGRLSDTYGKVRLFNPDFLIFTVGSMLLYLTPGIGYTGGLEIRLFRIIQAVGESFTMEKVSQ